MNNYKEWTMMEVVGAEFSKELTFELSSKDSYLGRCICVGVRGLEGWEIDKSIPGETIFAKFPRQKGDWHQQGKKRYLVPLDIFITGSNMDSLPCGRLSANPYAHILLVCTHTAYDTAVVIIPIYR